jgi:hypothetical protein
VLTTGSGRIKFYHGIKIFFSLWSKTYLTDSTNHPPPFCILHKRVYKLVGQFKCFFTCLQDNECFAECAQDTPFDSFLRECHCSEWKPLEWTVVKNRNIANKLISKLEFLKSLCAKSRFLETFVRKYWIFCVGLEMKHR